MGIPGQFGIGGPAAVGARGMRPRVASSLGFTVPEAAPGEVQAAGAVATPSLLALQEAGQDAVRDREAREHGESVLHVLAALQRALLGDGDPALVDRLSALVRRAPLPADPRLAAVQRAVLVRAAVEVARARVAASA